jgi:threonine/homoserine/homoserine lactone efflux protein
MQDPALFALAVITLLITPGPTNTLLATAGATGGFRRSVPLLLGELAGYNISIYTLGSLFDSQLADSQVRVALSLAAGAYLALTAVKFWRTPLELRRATVSLRQVFITTLLNPKALVFAFLIVPMRLPNTWLYLASFSAIVVVVGTVWIAFGTWAGRVAGSRFLTVVPKAASVALAIFATTLVVSTLVR